jgi:hypothetical protein
MIGELGLWISFVLSVLHRSDSSRSIQESEWHADAIMTPSLLSVSDTDWVIPAWTSPQLGLLAWPKLV